MVQDVIKRPLPKNLNKKPGPVIQPGSPKDIAEQLGIPAKRLRYILRLLTPKHMRCTMGLDGSRPPNWGRLNPDQIALITKYHFGSKETKKKMVMECGR